MSLIEKLKDRWELSQIDKELKKDPWLYEVILYFTELLDAPDSRQSHPVAEFLQTAASHKTRKAIAAQITAELLAIAQAKDRVMACRQWIYKLVLVHGKLRVLFLTSQKTSKTAAGELYHPGVTGLSSHIEDVIRLEFEEEARQAGGIQKFKEQIRAQNLRSNFDLNIANYGRLALGDSRSDRKDWLRPFTSSVSAFWENVFRIKLGLPILCSSDALLLEKTTLEKHILGGQKDPLQGVQFADRISDSEIS